MKKQNVPFFSFFLLLSLASAAYAVDIPFTLDKPANVSLGIYDGNGRLMRTLLRAKPMAAGRHTIPWDGLDRNGMALKGDFQWRLATSQGLQSEYLLSIGTSMREHHWPAQHGAICGLAVDKERIYVTAGLSEGMPQTAATTRDGAWQWVSGPTGGWMGGYDLAVDGDTLYFLGGPIAGDETDRKPRLFVQDAATGRVREGERDGLKNQVLWGTSGPLCWEMNGRDNPSRVDARDGELAVASPSTGLVVWLDPATGKDTVVAGGFQIPAAANFGPDGNLYAIDTKTGELKRIDMKTKAVSVIATLAPALDNLAIAKDGTIYVSNMAEATIYAINPADGAVRKVVSGPLATPTDLVMSDGPEGEKLHVADVFTYRVIDTATKAITDPLRMYRDETENQLGIGAGKSKVLITSWAAGMVQVVDRATGAAKIHHGFTAPTDALELADGRLIALEAATGAIRPVTDTEAPGAPIVSGLNFPVAMVEAGNGKLYVTETNPQAKGALAEVDLATGAITRVLEGLEGPEGVDVGADGRVYLAEASAGRVIAFDPKDKSRTVIAEGLKTGLPAAEGTLPAYTTTGLAVSRKDGSVYVASDITNAIYRITPPQN